MLDTAGQVKMKLHQFIYNDENLQLLERKINEALDTRCSRKNTLYEFRISKKVLKRQNFKIGDVVSTYIFFNETIYSWLEEVCSDHYLSEYNLTLNDIYQNIVYLYRVNMLPNLTFVLEL